MTLSLETLPVGTKLRSGKGDTYTLLVPHFDGGRNSAVLTSDLVGDVFRRDDGRVHDYRTDHHDLVAVIKPKIKVRQILLKIKAGVPRSLKLSPFVVIGYCQDHSSFSVDADEAWGSSYHILKDIITEVEDTSS